MTAKLDSPLSCPVVVGRTAPLETLERLLRDAHAGQGAALLISGEAGIGKTRLVSEARAQAAALGLQVLSGASFEPDRAVAYAPLVDLLRSLLADRPAEDLARVFGAPGMRDLADLLPELEQWLSEPAAGVIAAGPPEATTQRRRTQAIAQLLVQLASMQPLLVILEDLHWSDQASLDVVQHLARHLRGAPLLLLLTYRVDEVGPDLQRVLVALDRERLAGELHLHGLDANEVALMLRAILGLDRPVRSELVDLVYGLTEGNPFFIEEVLRSLLAAGDLAYTRGTWNWAAPGALRVPRTVHDAVQRRSAQLSGGAREVLEFAAIAGRRFGFELLEALSGRSENDVLTGLKELVAAGLVVEESAELFTFRHALSRQAVLEGLMARERRALHLRVAETLEDLHGDDVAWLDERAGDLAYHYAEAEHWARALKYAQRAGDRALALDAPQAAVEQLTRALEAAHQLRLPVPWQVYWQRGHAHEIRGAFDEALTDLETALEVARTNADLQAEWHTLLDLGILWSARDYVRAGTYFQAALDLARTLGDPPSIARSLNRVGNWLANQGEPGQAQAHHSEALSIFRSLDEQAAIAQTLDLLGMASHLEGNASVAVQHWRQAVAAFRALGDRFSLSSSLATIGVLASDHWTLVQPAGLHPLEGLRCCEEAIALARDIGWRPGQVFAQIIRLCCLTYVGDYARALEAIDCLALAEELEHRQWTTGALCALGFLRLDLFDHETAQRYFERALVLTREIGSDAWDGTTASGLARTLVSSGLAAQAATLLDGYAPERPSRTVGGTLLLGAQCEVALARGEPVQALELADELIGQATQGERPPGVVPRLLKLRGHALVALGRFEDGVLALQQARAIAVEISARPLLWRIDAALGRVFTLLRQTTKAQHYFNTARVCVKELADAIADASLRAGFLEGVAAELPSPRPLTPRRAAKQQFGGLTDRERDVAALITRGYSNREIADRLVLSERTVETHVRSILDRLAMSSRAQVAAWAQAHGLGSPTTV